MRRPVIAGLGLPALLLPALAIAEEPSPVWHEGFTITPYGWIAGIKGTAGTVSDDLDPGGGPMLPPIVDVSLEGDLEVLGFMFNAKWQGERWTAMFDSVWASVSQDASVGILPILPNSDIRANIDANVYLLTAGYRVDNWNRSSLQVFAGLRHYDLEITIDAQNGLLPQPISTSVSGRWQDGVIGAQWSRAINENWSLSLTADVGWSESNTSSEWVASAAYTFSTWSVVGGIRFLSLDYEDAGYRADLELYGPMIGVAFRF